MNMIGRWEAEAWRNPVTVSQYCVEKTFTGGASLQFLFLISLLGVIYGCGMY